MILLRIVIPFFAGDFSGALSPASMSEPRRGTPTVIRETVLRRSSRLMSMHDAIRNEWQIGVVVGMWMMRRNLTAQQAHRRLSALAISTGLSPADIANVIMADSAPDEMA